nr:hypothetical protein [Herbaspirillum sp. ASV7]
MLKKMLTLGAMCAALLLTGCATVKPMAYSKDVATPADDKVVYLMTATFKNVYRTSFQPKLLVAHIEMPNAQSKEERINFKIDDEGKFENTTPEVGNTYLLRMELPPGQYKLVGMRCLNATFPVVTNYMVPIHATLNASKPGTVYLGHVEAVLRERQGNEFRAGPPVPLIDQAVGGASGGTFDVVFSDRWEEDAKLFITRFPAIKQVQVASMPLPPFDRAYAQKWWEEH